MQITATVTGAWNVFLAKLSSFLPNLIGAVFIFILGWIIAKIIKAVTVKFFRMVRFDKLTDKAGVQDFLDKGGLIKTPSEIIGLLIYWFVMLIVLVASFDALGLPIVTNFLDMIFLYLPNVAAAIIIIILGFLLGNLISSVVRTSASNAGIKRADILGKIAFYAITVFTASVALFQLGIAPELIGSAFIILLSSAALALGLAFGLGGKDIAADYLGEWLGSGRKEKKTSGG